MQVLGLRTSRANRCRSKSGRCWRSDREANGAGGGHSLGRMDEARGLGGGRQGSSGVSCGGVERRRPRLERRDPRASVFRAAQCVSVGGTHCCARNAPRGAGARSRIGACAVMQNSRFKMQTSRDAMPSPVLLNYRTHFRIVRRLTGDCASPVDHRSCAWPSLTSLPAARLRPGRRGPPAPAGLRSDLHRLQQRAVRHGFLPHRDDVSSNTSATGRTRTCIC